MTANGVSVFVTPPVSRSECSGQPIISIRRCVSCRSSTHHLCSPRKHPQFESTVGAVLKTGPIHNTIQHIAPAVVLTRAPCPPAPHRRQRTSVLNRATACSLVRTLCGLLVVVNSVQTRPDTCKNVGMRSRQSEPVRRSHLARSRSASTVGWA